MKSEILTTAMIAIQEIWCGILCQMLSNYGNIRTWHLQPWFLKYQKVCGVNFLFFLLFSLRSAVGKFDTSIKEHALRNIAVKCSPLLACIREVQFRFLLSRPINLTKILWILSVFSAKYGINPKLVTGTLTSFPMYYPFTILSLLVVKFESPLINHEEIKYVSYFIMHQFCIESLLALYWDPQS